MGALALAARGGGGRRAASLRELRELARNILGFFTFLRRQSSMSDPGREACPRASRARPGCRSAGRRRVELSPSCHELAQLEPTCSVCYGSVAVAVGLSSCRGVALGKAKAKPKALARGRAAARTTTRTLVLFSDVTSPASPAWFKGQDSSRYVRRGTTALDAPARDQDELGLTPQRGGLALLARRVSSELSEDAVALHL